MKARRRTVVRALRRSTGLVTLAAAVVAYFTSAGTLRVIAGMFIAVALPVCLSALLVHWRTRARPEASLLVALAGWAVFESVTGLALWGLGISLSGASVGIPNILAGACLVLATIFARIDRPACASGDRLRRPWRSRSFLSATLSLFLLSGAALISVLSESRFYGDGNALAIFATRRNNDFANITIVNATSRTRVVVVRIDAGDMLPRLVSRSISGDGRFVLSASATNSESVSATLYEAGIVVGSVILRPVRPPD